MADPLNIVVDISHHNGNPDFQRAAAPESSSHPQSHSGTGFTDSKYLTNGRTRSTPACSGVLITLAPARWSCPG